MALDLRKRGTLDFKKDVTGGRHVSKLRLGLSWEPIKKTGILGMFSSSESVDLDSSCILFDNKLDKVDVVYFGKRNSRGVKHLGDDTTGTSKKGTNNDNETILVDLDNLDPRVKYVVFTVNSFLGHSLSSIKSSTCRIYDDTTGECLASLELDELKDTAVIMVAFIKTTDGWNLRMIEETRVATTAPVLVSACKQILSE